MQDMMGCHGNPDARHPLLTAVLPDNDGGRTVWVPVIRLMSCDLRVLMD